MTSTNEARRALWPIFPVKCEGDDKRPLVAWREESAPRHQWEGAWPKAANAYGIDCGKAGLVVIDEDQTGAVLGWLGYEPETYTVSTGRGRHLYFLADPNAPIHNSAGKVHPGIDVRGVGGYVVGAGSVHGNGTRYEIARDVDVARLPEDVRRLLLDYEASKGRADSGRDQGGGDSDSIVIDLSGYPERFELPEVIKAGHRDDTLFSYACSILARGRLTDDEGIELLTAAYKRCSPPWEGDSAYRSPEAMWSYARDKYGAEAEAVRSESALDQAIAAEAKKSLIQQLGRKRADRRMNEIMAEEFARAASGEATPEEERALVGRFTLRTPDDIRKQETVPDIVAGIIGPPGSINQISGERGSMKTLTTLGIVGAIGCCMDEVYGLPVNSCGSVLYCYLEGAGGLARRLMAWEDHHQRQMENVVFLHDPVDVKRPEDVRALAILARRLDANVIVLDSVAKTGGGKEDMEDFGAYRAGVEALRDATGAAVVMLHNSGYNKGRSRGHTTLVDGVDSAVLLRKMDDSEGGGVKLSDEKSRDSGEVETVRLEFEPCGPVNLATGEFWSGVVVRKDVEDMIGTVLFAHAELARDVLRAIDAHGPDGVPAKPLAAALGMDSTRNLAYKLRPLIEAEVVVDNGRGTTAKRYLRGPRAGD